MPRSALVLIPIALFAALSISGCLGGNAGAAPLTVIAEVYDSDDDGADEVVLELYFTRGDKHGIRVDATGNLNLARAEGDTRTQKADYEPIGAVRVEVTKDSRNWIDTDDDGSIYRQVMNDHHFDAGASYLVSVELRDGRDHYNSKAEFYYG